MTHPFRPADPVVAPTPPVGTWQQAQRWRTAAQLLARAARLLRLQRARVVLRWALLVAGVVCQLVLLLTVAYLCDLALALMELWAELARKHLELTL